MLYSLRTDWYKQACMTVILVVLLILSGGCSHNEPIKIGFVGELTGMQGGLGVAARDGAQLAVDEINKNGGIQGRPVELIVRDDQGSAELARQIDAELIERGVTAIIGHITSGQTAAVFDQMNKAEVVLVSPASSSSQFSGRVDHFFRVVPSTDLIGKSLARHIQNARNVCQLTGIYDLNNRAFAEPLWQAIQAEFTELGGRADKVFTFVSGETELKGLMTQVKITEPEAVVFIASPIDTALMVQYGRQQGLEAQFFSSSWAQTDELLAKGGQAVEGLELAAGYSPQNPYPPFERFVERFEARYSRQPDMLASNGYEAVLILAVALEQTAGRANGLPEALVTINNLEGTQGLFSIDAYGDVEREIYITQVKGGQFDLVSVISPASRE